MSDPLSIPEQKRGSGGLFGLFERPDRGWSFWIVIVVLVALNCWFDYYHPFGILFDIIVLIVWAVGSHVMSGRE
jgi:hypothetical protein